MPVASLPLPALPADLWSLVEASVSLRSKWRLLATCRELRDLVYASVQQGTAGGAPRFKSREQALAYIDVALLGRSIFLTGGAGII